MFQNSVQKNGRIISFWSDLWIGDKPLMYSWPNLYENESVKNCAAADRLIASENSSVLTWNWSNSPFSDADAAKLHRLTDSIREVRLSELSDKWICTGSPDGSFSVGSLRKLLVEDNAAVHDNIMEWVKWVPANCSIFFWKALQNRIPTRAELIKRNIFINDPNYCFCGDYEESTDHVFSGCSVTSQVWQRFCSWARLPPLFAFDFKDVAEFHSGCNLNREEEGVIKGLIMIACWCIWRA
ncbi:uncharacterized protein LOC110870450 [Helianthus annuus]|uniref:uncharacterized protein LOC110870450 n=1 Tax=Helianthus annuus TaxID=4232 RepID=UPI001652D04E|nr:uncharacterized protein LOC110870450 [Helianthus annuus]